MSSQDKYSFIESLFHNTMINIAKSMNYSESNILILENNTEALSVKFPEVMRNLASCTHNRDSRSGIEYARDLVCAWIFEDYFILNLRLFGIDISLNGEDKKREILVSSKVSTDSDYLVKYNGKSAYIELMNDYTSYWKRKKVVDLRDNKYNKLVGKIGYNTKSLFIGVDFVNHQFFLLDLGERLNVGSSQYHFYYSKPAYSIKLDSVLFMDFDFIRIADAIKSKML